VIVERETIEQRTHQRTRRFLTRTTAAEVTLLDTSRPLAPGSRNPACHRFAPSSPAVAAT
jgi:hypothetical protein